MQIWALFNSMLTAWQLGDKCVPSPNFTLHSLKQGSSCTSQGLVGHDVLFRKDWHMVIMINGYM